MQLPQHDRKDLLFKPTASSRIPTKWGDTQVYVFDTPEGEQIVQKFGDPGPEPLVRIHSECFTGDILKSRKCDCNLQLRTAQQTLSVQSGYLLYLRQEGRGIGLANKLRAYQLQDSEGLDTVEANISLGFAADLRDYKIAVDMLQYFGVDTIKLMTNNPKKIKQVTDYGLKVTERVPLIVPTTSEAGNYIKVKAEKLGHLID